MGRERTADDVDRALRASDLTLAATDNLDRSVVGVARVLTDFRYPALVLDVISAANHRGRGIGALVMDTSTAHPHVRGVETGQDRDTALPAWPSDRPETA